MDGYAGNIVYADLSDGKITIRPTPQELKTLYLGGRGFGIRLLTDMVDPKIEPLSDKNVIVYAAGPLTGTGIPLGSRYEVIDHLAAHRHRDERQQRRGLWLEDEEGRIRRCRRDREIEKTGLPPAGQREGRTPRCRSPLG